MRWFASYGSALLVTLLISHAALAGNVFPRVLVAPPPLKPYVDEILRGHGSAESLLRPGQDAHDFTLAPRQAAALAEAEILIVADEGMSPGLMRLAAKHKQLQIIALSRLAGADPLPYAPTADDAHGAKDKDGGGEHAHTHETGDTDPHLWLDPERMAALAPALAKAIADHSPEAAPALAANADALALHLRKELLPALQSMLKPENHRAESAEIPFVTYHAAYQYFLQRFALAPHDALLQRPESLTGAKTTAGLLKKYEKTKIRCIIGETQTPLMKRLAASTGARIVLLNPEHLPPPAQTPVLPFLHNDYDRLLYLIARHFARCIHPD